MTDASRIERQGTVSEPHGSPRMTAAAAAISGEALTALRSNQREMQSDMLTLQGALRALAVLVGSNNNARDLDPSDFEFLFNLLIERADMVSDHMSFAQRTLHEG